MSPRRWIDYRDPREGHRFGGCRGVILVGLAVLAVFALFVIFWWWFA